MTQNYFWDLLQHKTPLTMMLWIYIERKTTVSEFKTLGKKKY